MISIIHPSRGRPEKSYETISKWLMSAVGLSRPEIIVSLDSDDKTIGQYLNYYSNSVHVILNPNKSAVQAINEAAKKCAGDIIMVVSDDTEPINFWDEKIIFETTEQTDWIIKTQDGIQDYIITMPVMDRAYYDRTGYIYHPDFQHLFCDTYLTCVADITGRKLTSNLMFKHNHYSVNGTQPDELHKRNDATWKQGQDTFIKLMKEFTPQERARIQDPGMKNWLRKHGV